MNFKSLLQEKKGERNWEKIKKKCHLRSSLDAIKKMTPMSLSSLFFPSFLRDPYPGPQPLKRELVWEKNTPLFSSTSDGTLAFTLIMKIGNKL